MKVTRKNIRLDKKLTNQLQSAQTNLKNATITLTADYKL